MQMGMIGLGRMGSGMVQRLLAGGHQCVVYDQDEKAAAKLVGAGGHNRRFTRVPHHVVGVATCDLDHAAGRR